MKQGSHTSTEASQYSDSPALSMAAARRTLQLSQKVCASGLFSLHEQILASSVSQQLPTNHNGAAAYSR